MSLIATIALANGNQAQISDANGVLSDQIFGASGQPIGAVQILDQDRVGDPTFGGGDTVLSGTLKAVALSGGGFATVYFDHEREGMDIEQSDLTVLFANAGGQVTARLGLGLEPADEGPSGNPLIPPVLAALDGDRLAVAHTTFLEGSGGTALLSVVGANGGDFDTKIVSQPDTITHANGDITLTWTEAGTTFREVFGEDGTVLAARGVSHGFVAGVDSATFLSDFDAAHDQLTLVNADGSVAGGTASTLTFDARTHVLTWDPDSEGPAPATRAAVLSVDKLTVANLADNFRPEVLKDIAADGSTTIQWFDSDHSQTWDTLLATQNALGQLTTYSSTLDDGTKTVFTFDVDNSQSYQRFVDTDDAAGHVLTRTVIMDDGESWEAKFSYSGSQFTGSEVDSFDASGHLYFQSFFDAKGVLIAH